MRTFLYAVALLALILSPVHGEPNAGAPSLEERPELERFFAAEKVSGTFVLFDLPANVLRVFNVSRAGQRFIPASTFKIANSLIGLDAGAVRDVDEVLPYGGKPQRFKEWEHDMGLRKAIEVSAVPIYQELARRIGLQRMEAGVKAFEYGNQTIGNVVDRFWLDGPLEISALEQVRFLARLVKGELPVKPATLAAVKEITLREHSDTQELHFKTGWADAATPPVGWIVGWVTNKEGSYPFALNIDMNEESVAAKRLPIAKACLGALGKLH